MSLIVQARLCNIFIRWMKSNFENIEEKTIKWKYSIRNGCNDGVRFVCQRLSYFSSLNKRNHTTCNSIQFILVAATAKRMTCAFSNSIHFDYYLLLLKAIKQEILNELKTICHSLFHGAITEELLFLQQTFFPAYKKHRFRINGNYYYIFTLGKERKKKKLFCILFNYFLNCKTLKPLV